MKNTYKEPKENIPVSPISHLKVRATGILSDRKKAAAVFAIVIITVFAIWRVVGGQKKAPQYQTATAQKGTIVSTVTASGTVLTTNDVNITSSASGAVKDVFVKEGDQVTAGEKIMDISLDQPGQAKNAQNYSAYLSAKNNLDSANYSAFTLQSDMFSKWNTFFNLATNSKYQNSDGSPNTTNRILPEFTTAQDDWLAAEAKYKAQQAVISQAQAQVSSSWLSYQQSSPDVTAPIAGTISNITYIPGMVLAEQASTTSNSNQRVAVIQNNGTPSISVNLSETDVSKVKPGLDATVTLDSAPGKTFAGKVATVDKIGTVTNNVTNYPAVIEFDTSNQQVLPNMASTANIIIETKDNVLLVPTAAVQTQNGRSTVSVLKNGQPQSVDVQTGISSDTQIEITSGISDGDVVVTGTSSATSISGQTTSPFGGGGFGGFRPGGGGGRGGGGLL